MTNGTPGGSGQPRPGPLERGGAAVEQVLVASPAALAGGSPIEVVPALRAITSSSIGSGIHGGFTAHGGDEQGRAAR